MTKEDLKIILREKPGYLKCGAPKLSRLFSISKRTALEAVREVKEETGSYGVKGFRRLFFDIETSPNIVSSWRIGYNITLSPDDILGERAIICVSYKWEGESKVYNLTWDEDQNDATMLKQLSEVLHEADEIVAHNGDRFDIKWFRTRCLYHRIPCLYHFKTLDTLKKAKSGFYFNSNKLDYIGQFMKVGKKLETGGYKLWQEVCFKDNREALKTMVSYCDQDVLLLEKVYHELMNYVRPNTHIGVHVNEEKASCPNCASTDFKYDKKLVTALGTTQHRMQCNCCMSYFKISHTTYKTLSD